MAQVLDRAAVREALHDELATLRVLNRMMTGRLTRDEKTTAMQARSRSLSEIRRLLELLRHSDRLRLTLCQCGHSTRDHYDAPTHPCKVSTCGCNDFAPANLRAAAEPEDFEAVTGRSTSAAAPKP